LLKWKLFQRRKGVNKGEVWGTGGENRHQGRNIEMFKNTARKVVEPRERAVEERWTIQGKAKGEGKRRFRTLKESKTKTTEGKDQASRQPAAGNVLKIKKSREEHATKEKRLSRKSKEVCSRKIGQRREPKRTGKGGNPCRINGGKDPEYTTYRGGKSPMVEKPPTR